jgi:23S rRNA-/tRNA-specific pseudouridylate synthase
VVFAKTESAHRELNLAFLGRDVQKVYECLVLGEPNLPDFIVKTPIDGKPSQTRFRLVKSSKGVSLLKAFPKTGRLHQIRKHLAEMGLPILGDTKYAGLSTFQDIEFDRTSLHAQSLKLPGIDLIKAPHFEDFENWLELFNLESKKHDN